MITLPFTCREIIFGLLISLVLVTAWLLYEGATNDVPLLLGIGLVIGLVQVVLYSIFGIVALVEWLDRNVKCRCTK